jgi:hypothetical protein
MVPKKRFVRWAGIGIPAILLEGGVFAVLLHLCYLIAYHDLLFPMALCLVIQVCFFAGAFWAGKLARGQGRFGPMCILAGLSLWGTVLIVMHYGPLWKILPVFGDTLSFSIFMILVTLISWFVVSKTRPGRTGPL